MELRRILVLLVAATAILSAAPRLRLVTTVAGPFPVANGGSGTRTVNAYNIGDGNLALNLASSASWLTANTGNPGPCTQPVGRVCTPINLNFNMAGRPNGLNTAVLTITDPNALDAPQELIVTVGVGGIVPDTLEFVLPTSGTATTAVTKRLVFPDAVTMTAQSTPAWLTAAPEAAGTFRFNFPFNVRATKGSNGEGSYTGRLVVANSPFAADNKTVNATLRITNAPVLEVAPERIFIRTVRGGTGAAGIQLVNRGGSQIDASVTGSVDPGNSQPRLSWDIRNNNGAITANAENVAAGSYELTAEFAANGQTFRVPVSVTVLEPFAARPFVSGAVNNATFEQDDAVGRGAIVSLFGERLALTDPALAPSLPLPTTLGSTNLRVLLNGNPVPLYYTSTGQVNFQVPYDAPVGVNELRVERGGEAGGRYALEVVERAPRFLRLNVDDYGIVQNPEDGSLAIPSGRLPGANSRPARAGDVIVIYAIGCGETSPGVRAGEAAPSSPLAVIPGNVRVRFGGGLGGGLLIQPEFAGLAPGFAGLYQINVRVPTNAPRGARIPIALVGVGGGDSNTISIAID
jgi:uncharacterized protein (TIGR03437 family)